MRSLQHTSATASRASADPFPRAEFTAFYRQAFPVVYSYLANRCGSTDQAEDLLQDCFAAVFTALQNRGEAALSLPWLMRVARNKLVDHYRREHVRRVRLPILVGSPADELVIWHGETSRDKAQESLLALSADHRCVLVLRHMDGLSVPEIADEIGRSVCATSRARQFVRSRPWLR